MRLPNKNTAPGAPTPGAANKEGSKFYQPYCPLSITEMGGKIKMATIQKQGRGYKITVSQGYDCNGKRIRQYMTWVPEPGMTERQIKKELSRQAVLFEEKVLSGTAVNGNIRFADFAEIFLRDYARPYLKAATLASYEQKIRRFNQAIGHIKLNALRAAHINSFYQNLQEDGIKTQITAVSKIDLRREIYAQCRSLRAFSKKAGVAYSTLNSAVHGKPVRKWSADTIAHALGMETSKAFTVMTQTGPIDPATVLAYHGTLSAILNRAVKWGYIQHNPANNAEKPSLRRREAAYLEEEDARRLLELLQAEPIHWRAPIIFDLMSGLRRGELLGLRWQDADLDKHTVSIRQTSNYLPGKGVYVDTPKTASSARPLLLSTAAIMILLEYKDWQDAQRDRLGDAWEDQDGRIFTTATGAPIPPDSVTQWFRKFIARSGMPKVTIHSLRHTYASLMIADGVPLVVVSHQLGHAKTSTTANIYTHIIASAQAKAVQTFDRFNDLVGPGPDAEQLSEDKKKSVG